MALHVTEFSLWATIMVILMLEGPLFAQRRHSALARTVSFDGGGQSRFHLQW